MTPPGVEQAMQALLRITCFGLLLTSLASCGGTPNERLSDPDDLLQLSQSERQRLWSRSLGVLERAREIATATGSTDDAGAGMFGDEVLVPAVMARLGAEALAERWTESPACTIVGDPAIRQHTLILTPLVRHQPVPHYPESACRDRPAGFVAVEIIVGRDGISRQPALVRGLSPGLDAEALAVAGGTTWWPARVCGTTVSALVTMAIEFSPPAGCAAR